MGSTHDALAHSSGNMGMSNNYISGTQLAVQNQIFTLQTTIAKQGNGIK